MIDNLFFIYCALLSFSGFIIAFYKVLSQEVIGLEVKIGMEKGFDFDTDDGNEYFAERIDKWKVGTLFNSKFAVLIGLIIVLAGASLNLIKNSWWTSLLLLFISYFLYLYITKLLKYRAQLVSILILFTSIILIIFKLL